MEGGEDASSGSSDLHSLPNQASPLHRQCATSRRLQRNRVVVGLYAVRENGGPPGDCAQMHDCQYAAPTRFWPVRISTRKSARDTAVLNPRYGRRKQSSSI